MWLQKTIRLQARSRGFHVITDEIEAGFPEMGEYRVGLCHLFLKHTSASLMLNEHTDADVHYDLEMFFNKAVPEGADYLHSFEGADDMPAHIKTALLGVELTIPVSDGRLKLGAWQGILLGEHRNHAQSRSVIVTLQGEVYK